MTDTAQDTDHTQYPQTTPETIFEARGWLLDCGFSDELVFDLTDNQIARFVDREYDGGWTEFVRDSTGHAITRQIPRTTPSTATAPADALIQWSVLVAKAYTLGRPLPENTTTTP